MDRSDVIPSTTCRLCGEVFRLPENKHDGNLPHPLLCGHICTSCLRSTQCDGDIKCAECEVESILPEGGVSALQEDGTNTDLIYTDKMNKMKILPAERSENCRKDNLTTCTDNGNPEEVEQLSDTEKIEKVVDEALALGAENLAQLEHIHETLANGLAEQMKKERTRLAMEIKQATDEGLQAIQQWKDVQLGRLTELEAQFSAGQAAVCCIQEKIKAVELAMEMAREVQRVPLMEQYCVLDKVLETLQAPVDKQSFDLKHIAVSSGMSCMCIQSQSENKSLVLSLKMEVTNPEHLSQTPHKNNPPSTSNKKPPWKRAEGKNGSSTAPKQNKLPTPRKTGHDGPGAKGPSSRSPFPSSRPFRRVSLSRHNSASDLGSSDVIIEEVLEDGQKHAVPPTGPELANVNWRIQKRRKSQSSGTKTNVTRWVVVTHIVNPNHFYVRYVGEKRESDILSKLINHLCSGDGCHFTSGDTVETGSIVFVRWNRGLWCRAAVVELLQSGCVKAVKTCSVSQLASVQVFFLDHGVTKSITIMSEDRTSESSLKAVNNQLRKLSEAINVDLCRFAPQAIRCSLKDLVPYDPTKGWSTEAQAEFHSVVGSAAVELQPLGQDRVSLLVDLKKSSMGQSGEGSISVRDHLIFMEVARFYSPVKLGKRAPLTYYRPVYPKINTELSAVVSHINNPSSFFIQLVNNAEFLLLSAKLHDFYNAATVLREDELSVYCPVIGQACVARFDDMGWYRAQVVGHAGGRRVEVLYVDFGNKKILSVSNLRKMKDEFFVLPSMAIHCRLSDVTPVDGQTWSDACTNRFISLAHQKLVTIVSTGFVPKSEPLPVKLFEGREDGPPANIAEVLVKEELARSKEGRKFSKAQPSGDDYTLWDPPLELSLTTEEADSTDQAIPEEENEDLLEFQPQLKLPAELKDLKVQVSHVNSPSSFYVQFARCEAQSKRVCERVKQECSSVEPQDVVWKADMYCAAHINGVWERGLICSEVTSSNIAEVRRCDHGNVVKLHVSNLRPLPSSLIGSLALECTLNDIRPAGGRSTWTVTACDIFSYYLTGASAVVTIKELTDERPVPVTLLCTNKVGQFTSLADFLLSEGLALRERKSRVAVVQQPKETEAQSPVREKQTDDKEKNSLRPFTMSHPPKPAPRTIITAEKVQTTMYLPPELPCSSHIQINVSAVGEDGRIYVTTQNAERQLERLQTRIQQTLKAMPRQKPYTWNTVLGCAVIGPDMVWYRGQLLEVLGGYIKVQYVDYGMVENIPVGHVYPTLLCEDVPQLCVPCQLLGVNPLGDKWHQDAVTLLKELLVNRRVDMDVVELPADPRGPLTVNLFLDGLSLGKILCHHEHATMDLTVSAQNELSVMSPAPVLDDWDVDAEGLRDAEEPMLGPFVQPNLPQEGQHVPVKIKHLLTPNQLFLWPSEETADGKTLDETLSRINADTSSLSRLTCFPPGGPCLAEYSDGNYYRARLIEFISMKPVTVLIQHVDFGSDDIVPISKLRQMPPELLQFAPRALKVRVAGFRPPDVKWENDVLPYSPEWSMKATAEMLQLLHGNITACVVAREPELTVLLYNEDGELVHLPLVDSGLVELD